MGAKRDLPLLEGLECARLTPLQYRFALIRASYPPTKKFTNAWCARQAGSGTEGPELDTVASRWYGNPLVQRIITRERERQADQIRLSAGEVLSDLLLLKDQAMARIPIAQDERAEDGTYQMVERLRYDAATARSTLELLGKHLGLWEKRTETADDALDREDEAALQEKLKGLLNAQ